MRERPLWVKICGIRDQTAALAAEAAGADAIGFVFAESPRRLTPAAAAGIGATAGMGGPSGGRPARVGVFVDASFEEIAAAADQARLSHVQLHGDESPELIRRLRARGLRTIKAVRLRSAEDLAGIDRCDADLILLDAFSTQRAGGTGERFDWSLAVEAARRLPVVLAGGLTPYNVGDAVRQVMPLGVDVSSGVEREPGRKDPARVASFVGAAQAAWRASVLRQGALHREAMDRVRRAT